MLAREYEPNANFTYIHNCNNVEAVGMFWMRKAPFYELVKVQGEVIFVR
jgi:hypothetical protein